MPFSDLIVRTVPGGKYELVRPMVYWYPESENTISVPATFRSDFASIPRGFRWLITGHDGTRKPAVLHDYLYKAVIGTRKGADLLFRAGMRETGVPAWKRELAYRAVRVGGWLTWSKYAREKRRANR